MVDERAIAFLPRSGSILSSGNKNNRHTLKKSAFTIMTKPKRSPDNWQEIAFSVKESALWRCAKCHQQCLRPGKKTDLTKSDRLKLTLTVHHRNRIPEDNRPENLVALCTACHLSYHNRGESNVSPGQLSLFPDDDIDA
jgi:hypothetical protein